MLMPPLTQLGCCVYLLQSQYDFRETIDLCAVSPAWKVTQSVTSPAW